MHSCRVSSQVALSGVVQALRQLGSLNALTNTSYGTLLIWKVIAVAMLIAIAAVSRQATHGKALGRITADSVTIDRARLVRVVVISHICAVGWAGLCRFSRLCVVFLRTFVLVVRFCRCSRTLVVFLGVLCLGRL